MADEPRYLRRMDGRLERVCPHGIGHTVNGDRVRALVPYENWSDRSRHAWWVHGCDGCCSADWRLHD